VIACVDVDYRGESAVAAAVAIARWEADRPLTETIARISKVERYEPGAFYLRELPCLVEVLRALRDVDTVVIDGYVWLAKERAGLGARLHATLGGSVTVVGVAKTAFRDNDVAVEVARGTSSRPLYVTAEGIDVARAAAGVRRMHGAHRIPTILKRVDRLARDSVLPG
jgi:deoxyribonuclease V